MYVRHSMIDTMQNIALDFLCFGALFSVPVALGIGMAIFSDALLHIRNRIVR
jgi:hypothetical protein